MPLTSPLRRRPDLLVLLLLAAALLAATASSASAYGTHYAKFDATISGTYVNEGTLTSSGCFRYDEEAGEQIKLPPVTGTHSERTSFRSVRSTVVGFQKPKARKRITAGGKPIPVDVKMERASDLVAGSAARGCSPVTDRFKTRCGTQTQRFQLGLFALGGRSLSYNLSNGFSTVFPGDPFEECPVADSSHWWGGSSKRGNGEAKLSAAKLFDTSVKRIVLHGTMTTRSNDTRPDEEWQASGTETLRWTVVLVRRAA